MYLSHLPSSPQTTIRGKIGSFFGNKDDSSNAKDANLNSPRSNHPIASRADPHPSDEELITAVAKKDRVAFEQLFYAYFRRLIQFVHRLCHDEAIVEEIVNDTLFTVWEKANTFEGRSRVSTWIFGIAYRKTLKAMPRNAALASDVDLESAPADESQYPDALLEQLQKQQWLQSGIVQLSPEHRAVVELTYFHGYSYQEIAEIMNCPMNTVKTRMYHARKRLQIILPQKIWQEWSSQG